MKNILSVLILILSSVIYGQVTILEENFDNFELPEGWGVITGDSNTVNASVAEYDAAWIAKGDPFDANNGTISSTSYFSPGGRADRWLVTPQLNLGTAGNFISWNGMSHDPSFPDSYKVLVSTTGNEADNFTDTIVIVSNEIPVWTKRTMPLDKYANTSIFIAFVNTTFDGFKLYLDSIYVRELDPLSIQEEEIDVTVYPNPVLNELYINTANSLISQVQIYNSLQQEVFNDIYTHLKNDLSIELDFLKKGVYFVNIYTTNGVVIKKIIK